MSRILDLEITALAHGGVCVARREGRVVFVADAVPGERVRALRDDDASTGSATDDRRSFWRATTVEVLDPSPYRRPHIWPEADLDRDPAERPGGADLGHIDLGYQRELKRGVLAEALDRFAGGGLAAPEVRGLDDSDGTRWRTRVTLHVDDEGRMGPFAARRRRVIEVTDHPLARPAITAASPRASRPGRVTLVEPGDGIVRVLAPGIGTAHADPEVVWERIGERRFALDVDGFWQVHPAAATALDAEVRTLLCGRVDPDAAHLDLYGGVGLFAATLGDLGARRIVTVESSRRATAHAEKNLADIPVRAITARVDRFLARLDPAEAAGFAGGTVVLDPPRAGAGRAVVEAIADLHPAAIVYVACDPVALARDLKTFRDRGWEAASLQALDLFPHSHHFETVALLVRGRLPTPSPAARRGTVRLAALSSVDDASASPSSSALRSTPCHAARDGSGQGDTP